MLKTSRRRSLTIAAALTGMLAAPAAAQAVNYTVAAGNGTCGGSDTACATLVQAAAAVSPGDMVGVAPGTYAESPDFTDANVKVVGSLTAPGVLITGSITFSGNGDTPSTLQTVVVAPSTATNAVGVTGNAGVAVSDSVLLSTGGTGITVANGAANSITRSSVVSTAAETAAVLVQPGASAAGLTLDSSIISGGGGASGAGILVKTGGLLGAGNGTITARHITVAGSANGISLDASGAISTSPVGNIAATVTDSIVLGANPIKKYAGILGIGANTATLDFARTDQTSAPEALFVNPSKRNYRLRAGSPAIDKGQITPGDSATDIEGQPRTVGVASDLGADEFVAGPPPAGPGGGGGPTTTTDGDLPKVVITKPKANEKIPVFKTKTTTVIRNGKRIKRKTKTTTRTKIAIEGTATDKSGVKGVVLTIEKLSSTTTATSAQSAAAPTTTAKKCKWLNPVKKAVVLRSCAKPVVLLAKLDKDKFSYKISSSIKLGAGVYRVIVAAADNAGGFGNSASTKDAIHRFTLTK